LKSWPGFADPGLIQEKKRYLLEGYRYIELNPINTEMVMAPQAQLG
jgi:hypothetical protein